VEAKQAPRDEPLQDGPDQAKTDVLMLLLLLLLLR
jgi:hypothetical protein